MQVKVYYKDGTIYEGRYNGAVSFEILHREDGPAVEWSTGIKEWYLNGKRHREDGPAVEGDDGRTYWYINDKWFEILPQEYLIRYMELANECLASLLLSPDKVLRESAKKYKWKELNNAS